MIESKKELSVTEKKIADKETEILKKKVEKLNSEIENQTQKIDILETEKAQVNMIFQKYYDGDNLKSDFSERTDTELINHFKNGVLSCYKSDDIVLRTSELLTILDNIRKEVTWE